MQYTTNLLTESVSSLNVDEATDPNGLTHLNMFFTKHQCLKWAQRSKQKQIFFFFVARVSEYLRKRSVADGAEWVDGAKSGWSFSGAGTPSHTSHSTHGAILCCSRCSPRPAWICVLREGVCVSMYVHVLCVLHIVQHSLTSVAAFLEEFTPGWRWPAWPSRHADHSYIRRLKNFPQ